MKNRDSSKVETNLDLEERVRRRAHEIWLSRGSADASQDGGELRDWLQAEQEILQNDSRPAKVRRAAGGDALATDVDSADDLSG